MIYLLYTIHVIISLFLIMVVLLQQGKGADLSVFGGGATQAAFGARGAATMLHKLTVWAFVGFIFTTLTIGMLTRGASTSSVMSSVPQQESGAAAPAAADEVVVPVGEDAGEELLPAEEAAPSEDVEGAAADEDGGAS